MAAQTSFEKIKLSGSTDGMGIKVVASSTPGTTIHTAHATALDEVWLWAVNTHSAAVDLTIEYGGVTDPDNLINKDGIPVEDGLYLVVPGLIITNSKVIAAFAGSANVIIMYGYVNRMS